MEAILKLGNEVLLLWLTCIDRKKWVKEFQLRPPVLWGGILLLEQICRDSKVAESLCFSTYGRPGSYLQRCFSSGDL